MTFITKVGYTLQRKQDNAMRSLEMEPICLAFLLDVANFDVRIP